MNSVRKVAVSAVGSLLLAMTGTTGAHAQDASGPAFIVVELNVKNQEGFQAYAQKVPETIAQYGGTYVVRGGNVETLEGAEPDGRVVILRFDSVDDAKTWMTSPEYAAIKDIRHQTAATRSYMVEGLAPN